MATTEQQRKAWTTHVTLPIIAEHEWEQKRVAQQHVIKCDATMTCQRVPREHVLSFAFVEVHCFLPVCCFSATHRYFYGSRQS